MGDIAEQLQRRGATEALGRALSRHAIVLLAGPGMTGKTSVAHAALPQATYVSLAQDDDARRAALADPAGFLSRLGTPTVIDDAHLAPVLLDELQRLSGRLTTPGQILAVASLSGLYATSRRAASWNLPRVSIGSLTQGELHNRIGRFISAAFTSDPTTWSVEPLAVADYLERSRAGGLCGVHALEDAVERARVYGTRIDAKLALCTPPDTARLRSTLALLSARPSGKVTYASDAERLGVNQAQLIRDLELLEELGLVRLVSAWTRFRRTGDSVRAYLNDPGYLTALPNPQLTAADATELSLRTLAVHELCVQNAWARRPVELSFWRSKPSQFDIDVLLEDHSGGVVALSISPTEVPGIGDLAPIDAFRRRHPRAYRRGLLLHPGDRVVAFGEQRWAVPLSVLWTLAEREVPLDVGSLDTELEVAATELRVIIDRPRAVDPEVGERRAQLSRVMERMLTPRLERIALVLASLGLGAKELPVCADPPGPDDQPAPAWITGLRLTLLRNVNSPRLCVISGLAIDAGELAPPQAGSPRWVAFVSVVFDGTGTLRWHAGHALMEPPTDPPSEARLVGLAGPVLCSIGEVDEMLIDQLAAALAATLPDAMAALSPAR
ncbi:MAG: DUF4143 domain-containing protein [Acidimicrobiales bacterium]